MIQNKIALIFDFDMTLSPEYMQTPIFNQSWAKISFQEFWAEKRKFMEEHARNHPDVLLQEEPVYMNLFTRLSQPGQRLEGLTKDTLRECGSQMKFYPGLPDFFDVMREEIREHEKYSEFGIDLEYYIVSNGMAELVRGSSIADKVKHISGCEFLYDSNGVPMGTAYVLTNTGKTRLLFDIQKGAFSQSGKEIDADTKLLDHLKPIPFEHMIYYGDGPSDVPVMAALKNAGKNGGGVRIAVYNPNPVYDPLKPDPTINAMNLQIDGRADHTCSADYSKGSDLYMITRGRLYRVADKIITNIEKQIAAGSGKNLSHPT